jgi:opacity protein-like surface antigen
MKMKKVLSAMAVSGLILAGTTCFAADGMYVKGIAKYVAPSDPSIEFVNLEADNGYGWGAAVGVTMSQFRVEGEFSTQKTDLDAIGVTDGGNERFGIGSGDVRMDTYMLNGYWDIPLNNGFGLYLTGGLGYGTATVSIYDVDGDDGGFAWKGGAGVFYAIDDHMAVDLGWEYMTLDDADLDVSVTDLSSNNVVAAFRYAF